MPEREAQAASDRSRIRHDDPQVLLQPENNDLMVRTGKQVIQACELDISIELWMHEFESLREYVAKWAHDAKTVRSIYQAIRSGKIALFVSPKGQIFDFDLADSLAKLNTHLVKTFNVGMVEILQIPSEELDRFVDGGMANILYVEPAESHQPVEA